MYGETIINIQEYLSNLRKTQEEYQYYDVSKSLWKNITSYAEASTSQDLTNSEREGDLAEEIVNYIFDRYCLNYTHQKYDKFIELIKNILRECGEDEFVFTISRFIHSVKDDNDMILLNAYYDDLQESSYAY